MSAHFARNDPSTCSLCGGASPLTREHKIKASALRGQFAGEELLVGATGEPFSAMRIVQSANGDRLKFRSRICQPCNSARTQPADQEFDRFLARAMSLFEAGENPSGAFALGNYIEGSSAYLNLFRYFAKLICCQFADAGGPRPHRLAQFAVGDSEWNCVWLSMDTDSDPVKLRAVGLHKYASHGGLAVIRDKRDPLPTKFHSSMTIGSMRFLFWFCLSSDERLDLQEFHPHFLAKCKSAEASPD